jgi:hypothetical protein
MKFYAQNAFSVPEETARVARAAFSKGNVYLRIWDELGVLSADSRFAGLFSHQDRPGRLGIWPWCWWHKRGKG